MHFIITIIITFCISKYCKMPRSQFKIFEHSDLNISTPKTSRHIKKKLFTYFPKDGEPQSTWSEVIVNKQLSSANTQDLTPPSVKLLTTQPPAPTKPRKYIKKIDLKPKKLIFKDSEEPESDTVHLPRVFRIHSDENIPENILKSRKDVGNDRKLKDRRRIINDDNKENCVARVRIKSKSNLIKASSISLLSQQKNVHVQNGLKHFRV
ncbi:uncharacterized protein [Chelonus insularis]|uniref:uncharacterized protein n=1 Tax=Chelonus insularis TaxID=460826 RepID=UPI00158D2541|nr:uncharacterized protein LOC118065641 [Chelonus insularis]